MRLDLISLTRLFHGVWATPCLSCLKPHGVAGFNSHKMTMNLGSADADGYLYLGDTGGVPVLLSPGIHSFPFKLGLPLGLPSTFLGRSSHFWVGHRIPG